MHKSISHFDHPLGMPGDIVVVRDDKKCDAITIEIDQHLQDFGAPSAIEIASWFIGENYAGSICESTSNCNALSFSPRQLIWKMPIRSPMPTLSRHSRARALRSFGAMPAKMSGRMTFSRAVLSPFRLKVGLIVNPHFSVDRTN